MAEETSGGLVFSGTLLSMESQYQQSYTVAYEALLNNTHHKQSMLQSQESTSVL
jgi:hypothetical protein